MCIRDRLNSFWNLFWKNFLLFLLSNSSLFHTFFKSSFEIIFNGCFLIFSLSAWGSWVSVFRIEHIKNIINTWHWIFSKFFCLDDYLIILHLLKHFLNLSQFFFFFHWFIFWSFFFFELFWNNSWFIRIDFLKVKLFIVCVVIFRFISIKLKISSVFFKIFSMSANDKKQNLILKQSS